MDLPILPTLFRGDAIAAVLFFNYVTRFFKRIFSFFLKSRQGQKEVDVFGENERFKMLEFFFAWQFYTMKVRFQYGDVLYPHFTGKWGHVAQCNGETSLEAGIRPGSRLCTPLLPPCSHVRVPDPSGTKSCAELNFVLSRCFKPDSLYIVWTEGQVIHYFHAYCVLKTR